MEMNPIGVRKEVDDKTGRRKGKKKSRNLYFGGKKKETTSTGHYKRNDKKALQQKKNPSKKFCARMENQYRDRKKCKWGNPNGQNPKEHP